MYQTKEYFLDFVAKKKFKKVGFKPLNTKASDYELNPYVKSFVSSKCLKV